MHFSLFVSKVFKLGIGIMTLGYPRTDVVLEFQGDRLGLGLGYSNTAWVRTLGVPSSL